MLEDESAELLGNLLVHTTSETYTYSHHWRVGDILIWDNWRTMHMATGYKAKYVRTMHRTTIAGDWEMGRLAA
jgi:taurine dioxygenase